MTSGLRSRNACDSHGSSAECDDEHGAGHTAEDSNFIYIPGGIDTNFLKFRDSAAVARRPYRSVLFAMWTNPNQQRHKRPLCARRGRRHSAHDPGGDYHFKDNDNGTRASNRSSPKTKAAILSQRSCRPRPRYTPRGQQRWHQLIPGRQQQSQLRPQHDLLHFSRRPTQHPRPASLTTPDSECVLLPRRTRRVLHSLPGLFTSSPNNLPHGYFLTPPPSDRHVKLLEHKHEVMKTRSGEKRMHKSVSKIQ